MEYGATAKSITVAPTTNTTYTVNDGRGWYLIFST
jgi:hypothetical protein